MRRRSFMVIAGEASGDNLAAELVAELRRQTNELPLPEYPDPQPIWNSLAPRFFGAGGPALAGAGVELLSDLATHSVIGLSDALRKYFEFRRIFQRLLLAARERQPDVIICVDFSGFNRRFARAIRREAQPRGWFHAWRPLIVQYVSPQVWASRPGRSHQLARDFDLLLSTFPFEQEWYAKRVPRFRVEFVGNPVLDRHAALDPARPEPARPEVLLLPGSRRGEMARHWPALAGAFALLRERHPGLTGRLVAPDTSLLDQARTLGIPPGIELQTGGLDQALRQATVAIASTGTVTLECALHGVPTVAIYKTSWSTYQIGRRIIQVRFLAMPNLLAGKAVFPELIQGHATAPAIAAETEALLSNAGRRAAIRQELRAVVQSLGAPGAAARAARAILERLDAARPPRTEAASSQGKIRTR